MKVGTLLVLFSVFRSLLGSDQPDSVRKSQIDPRIVNGELAVAGEFPYYVSVGAGATLLCGGTLISQVS
jgi:secreted trypsin-like serine protease